MPPFDALQTAAKPVHAAEPSCLHERDTGARNRRTGTASESFTNRGTEPAPEYESEAVPGPEHELRPRGTIQQTAAKPTREPSAH